METGKIRDSFIAFFTERGHQHVPSASLVPNDPTLLFTNAGMNQFKPYFQGEQTPPYDRAVTSQKCIRAGGKHNDLEEVGKTTRHLTFFEMLGNFSFGDYFKEAICKWSWELATEGWGMEPERLWASVYETDDEAYDIWRDHVGVPESRILRLGKKDNYWSMGVAGPCGPCSELHYDRGEGWGAESARGPLDNDERYLEFWNLVFMQNECNDDLDEIGELPKKNIDTGAGLERIAMLLQDKPTVFESDVLAGMIDCAAEVTGKPYGRDERTDFGLRVLADHGRSTTFAIGDGVLPSNEERGYVLRRIMRRAVRHSRLIGHDEPILRRLVGRCVDLMGDAYPEIVEKRSFIEDVADREEERFATTLKQGLGILDDEIVRARDLGAGIPGDIAFKLHDTFGFPIDLTTEIAQESGLSVDTGSFEVFMSEQRTRARAAKTGAKSGTTGTSLAGILEDHGVTDFIGYEHPTTSAEVVALLDGDRGVPVAATGDEVQVILDRTVFYAAGGGQVGDRGTLTSGSGSAQVLDTTRLLPGLFGHRVTVTAGELKVGDSVEAAVDGVRRRGTERAHTATHVLHWILRDRLGEHAKQAGSLVEPGRLRFDFNHFEALGDGIEELSDELQRRTGDDDPVRAFETSYDYAKSLGAMAIFGEKYGDVVRVVEVGEYSKELCGGTHVPHTSQIGVVVVTGEGSVGANLRRIEALVGDEGVTHLQNRVKVLERAADLLKTNPDEVAERIERLLVTHKEMEKRIAESDRRSAEGDARQLASDAEDLGGSRLVVARRDASVDQLRSLAQKLRGTLGSGVVILGTVGESNANIVVGVTKDLVERGITARDVIAAGAAVLGGGGGGKPELAISGGPNKEALDRALAAAAAAARAAVT
ncbi:MAG: alanine--tRNA ligase [Actinomycetota bacterium]